MVSFFSSSKDKEKKKKEKEKKEDADEQSKLATESQEPLESQATPQADGAVSVERAKSSSPDANEVDTTTPSALPAESISSEASAPERRVGRMRFASSYVGGADGSCTTCGLVKLACNCQRCHCCNKFLLSLSSRKHCRRCWRASCPKCASHERTNEFMNGEVSRTCKVCAVPRALLYLTELAYSSYETVGAASKQAAATTTEGEEGAVTEGAQADGGAAADGAEAAPTEAAVPLEAHAFRWGLYALGCVMVAPRRCINPSCAAPLMYEEVCPKCRAPTVTMAYHQPRHVEALDAADLGSTKSSGLPSATAEAIEEAVRAEYDSVAATRTSADEDAIFAAALPNELEGSLFATLDGNAWAARKVLMSLAASTIAGEAAAMPNIALAMTSLPAYTQLLRPLQTTDVYTVFTAPGHVRFFAFSSGASNRAGIHQVLGTSTSVREAWTSGALRGSQAVAKLVPNAASARSNGLTECVGRMQVREGLLAYVNENDVMRTLPEQVRKSAKAGVDVVLCGHGIGGAVATWVAANLLLESTAELRDRLLCVTFGAPLVASHGLTDVLIANQLQNNFQHFVHGSDMVPRMEYVDSLLASGNTNGTASIAGHGQGMATAAEVRSAVVRWTGRHEEPRGAAPPPARTAKESPASQLAAFARRMRSSGKPDSGDKKEKQAEAAAEDVSGDIFKCSREPFDNNIIRSVEAEAQDNDTRDNNSSDGGGAARLHDVDLARYATAAHRTKQTFDPCGCYHFLWHPRGRYICTSDPATAIGLLSDRTDLRVELQDHVLSSYNRAMVEYMYSVPAGQ